MLASHAIAQAIKNKSVRLSKGQIELSFEWASDPGWHMMRYVTALRALLSDMFECNAEVVSSGPGCFFVIYSLPITPDRFTELMAEGAREQLQELKQRFEINRLNVRTPDKKFTVFA